MKEDSRKYLLIVIFKALVVLWTGAATVLPSATTSQSTRRWNLIALLLSHMCLNFCLLFPMYHLAVHWQI